MTAPCRTQQTCGVDRILMIYNADGGLMNGAMDLLHKAFSPANYACRLCEVTYGLLGMKRDWRTTIEALPLPVLFLHRDEWQEAFPGHETPLPAILLERSGQLTPLVSADDFAAVGSLEALKALLAERLSVSVALPVSPAPVPPAPGPAAP